MKTSLAITRCAVLTPLDAPQPGGHNTWSAIRAGQCVGATPQVDDRLLADDPSLDRSIRLALAAAKQALGQAPAMKTDLKPTGLFCGTSKGPVTVLLQSCRKLREGHALSEMEARHVALGVGAMGAFVGQRLGISQVHTSVAACASGMHALHRAAQALWRGECARALVVAADASLHPLFDASFARLGVLSPADARGVRKCEPFGAAGEGFFLAEAAAALVLEVAPPSSAPLAWLHESWIGADGTALIAVDPQTQSLRHGLHACASDALRRKLAFVHAHATGTSHDAYESEAIRSVAGPDVPVFSHKRFLGHSLGAAGLVSVALSVECHHRRETLIGTSVAADSLSLTIAQGFGGHVGIVTLGG